MPSNASIQHYFNPHSLPSKHSSPFTSNPISSILTPGESSNISAKSQSSSVTNTGLQRQWIPKAEYEETDIAALVPGPGRVMIGGRIVNFYDQKIEKKTSPQAARGCIKLIVKDDTGVIAIKLWYADRFAYITLRLGQLVTICTPHISNTTTANSSTSATAISNHAGVMASIFPERDNSCSFTMQDASDDGTLYRRPLDYDTRKSNATLSKLVTLKAFVEGAYERTGVRILVCVKSLGARKIGGCSSCMRCA
ncbi:hypothetical protein MMC25_002418 [Agyrium rufum]|nr:hypothetical protein [Agyrium rufum]